MRSANRTICASSVEGGGIDHGWFTIPSRTSHVRFRPSPSFSRCSTTRSDCSRVAERPAEERRERLLPQVSERRVPEVVPERDRLREVLVQPEGARRRPRDLRHVQGVRQPDPIVVALRRQEHLCLVLQAAERLGVHDPVAVPLVDGPEVVVRLLALPALGLGCERSTLRQDLPLDLLGSLSGGRHELMVAATEAHRWSATDQAVIEVRERLAHVPLGPRLLRRRRGMPRRRCVTVDPQIAAPSAPRGRCATDRTRGTPSPSPLHASRAAAAWRDSNVVWPSGTGMIASSGTPCSTR